MQKTHYARTLVLGLIALVLAIGRAEAIDLRSWDQVINKPKRFIVLSDFNNEAVLDLETQLVWEQNPEAVPPFSFNRTWANAVFMCYSKHVGGRYGWRLPTLEELASLMDPEATSGPVLPPGHPFTNVKGVFYWSATTKADDPSAAMGVHFNLKAIVSLNKAVPEADNGEAWCVRGGHGHDGGH